MRGTQEKEKEFGKVVVRKISEEWNLHKENAAKKYVDKSLKHFCGKQKDAVLRFR